MKKWYWFTPKPRRNCKQCGKQLGKKIRSTNTGYCQTCRLKLLPPGLGSKRPDAVAIINKYRPKGKDNYFYKVKFKGKNHAGWKGSNVGYDALHTWLKRELGQPTMCEFCRRDGLSGRLIHWANKSGKYLRDLSDWLRLCAKCHYHYDRD